VFSTGDQPVAAVDQQVGWVTSANEAYELVVTECGDVQSPAGTSATCLAAPHLAQVGTYAGTATFPGTTGPDGKDPGRSKVSIVVQDPRGCFLLLAVIGTLFSVFAAWFVSEYQAIRRLRAGRDELAADTSCPPDNANSATPLRLTGGEQFFKANDFGALDHYWVKMWLNSLRGKRPDFKSLNKALEQARATRALFDALCATRVKLLDGVGEIKRLGEEIGIETPELVGVINSAVFAPAALGSAPKVPFDQMAAFSENWGQLQALTERWRSAASHVLALCAWRQKLTGEACAPVSLADPSQRLPDELRLEDLDPTTGYPMPQASERPLQSGAPEDAGQGSGQDADETGCEKSVKSSSDPCCLPVEKRATLSIEAARGKLQVVKTSSDFDMLHPEGDIQAAWLALEEIELKAATPAGTTAAMAAFAQALPSQAKGMAGPPLDLASAFRKIRHALERLEPVLNGTVILGLSGLSFAATVLVGLQALYIDKPWGSLQDYLVLLLLGGGIHAGVTGVAAVVMSGARKEVT